VSWFVLQTRERAGCTAIEVSAGDGGERRGGFSLSSLGGEGWGEEAV